MRSRHFLTDQAPLVYSNNFTVVNIIQFHVLRISTRFGLVYWGLTPRVTARVICCTNINSGSFNIIICTDAT